MKMFNYRNKVDYSTYYFGVAFAVSLIFGGLIGHLFMAGC